MARILVAEDEIAVREFIRRVLEQRGHEVVTVSDGAEALVKLRKGPFDLLLTDIGMPNMDGLELALKVARDQPEMPVLMMSGYAVERRRAHRTGPRPAAKALLDGRSLLGGGQGAVRDCGGLTSACFRFVSCSFCFAGVHSGFTGVR
jgi:two-component system cell cycle response regulator CpdR